MLKKLLISILEITNLLAPNDLGLCWHYQPPIVFIFALIYALLPAAYTNNIQHLRHPGFCAFNVYSISIRITYQFFWGNNAGESYIYNSNFLVGCRHVLLGNASQNDFR